MAFREVFMVKIILISKLWK